MAAISTRIDRCLIRLINAYQSFLSPFWGSCCRFEPSCSEYAKEAVQHHGCLRGLGLSVLRVLRCQPFCEGGYDPVKGLGNKSRFKKVCSGLDREK